MTSKEVFFPLYSLSHKGRRRANEDAVLIKELRIQGVPILIAAVADGMGGHLAGDVASRMATERFISHLESALLGGLEESHLRGEIYSAYEMINRELLAEGEKNPNLEDMGTTLTALIVIEDRFLISSLGDTRAYKIFDEQIEQITEDHSAGAQSLKEGTITEIEAREHRYSGSLVRYLGATEDYPPDIFPESGCFKIDQGQVLMLCSDGVSGVLDEIDIYEQITQSESLEGSARNLVQLSFLKGSTDNMSIILVETKILPRKKPYLAALHVLDDTKKAKLRSKKKKNKKGLFITLGVFLLLEVVLGFMVFRELRRTGREGFNFPASSKIMDIQKPPTPKPDKGKIANKTSESQIDLTQRGETLSWSLTRGQAEIGKEFEVEFYEDKDLKILFYKEKTELSNLRITGLIKRFEKGKEYYWRVTFSRAGERVSSESRPLTIEQKK